MRGSAASSERAQRVVVRREVAAEAVVERDRIEHLLIERLRVGVRTMGRSSRADTPDGDGAHQRRGHDRERPRPSVEQQPNAAAAITIDRVRDFNLFTRERRDDAQADERHHPEPRRHAKAVEAGQPHQPAVRRLIDHRSIEKRRIRARARTPTSQTPRADRRPAASGRPIAARTRGSIAISASAAISASVSGLSARPIESNRTPPIVRRHGPYTIGIAAPTSEHNRERHERQA